MPEKKTPRAPRSIRESTFLDDPTLYPEFKALTSKLPKLHAFRCGFHRHRTAVLALLVAVCMALSGVPRPPRGAGAADWIAFCASAVAVDRLKDHFEGFATSLAAMGVVAVLSIMVYPLYVFMTPKAAAASSGQLFARRLVTLGFPAAAVWSFAVWVKSRYVWGLASALWFALFCACVTLKITSFTGTATCALEEECLAVTPNSNGKPITAAAAAVSPASTGSVSRRQGLSAHPLTFREYLFFLFLTPSLVCEVHLMKESARRRSRPLRAASEFFHAALAFLVAHCMVGAVLAPSMRVFITGLRPQWVEGASPGWAELDDGGGGGGGGGWPSWEVGSGLLAEEGGKGPWVTLLSCLWMLTTVSSCVHFLVFYAFWHCVCLAMAELWGFPDRHLYGCWWLMFDEPREFLRMWSVPVHRWLSSCVHWPMLEAAARRSGANAREDVTATPVTAGNGRGTHAATEHGAGKGAESGGGRVKPAAVPGWLPAVAATFVVSGVYHEAIVYVAMRGTCWPFNTFLLCVAGGLLTMWDLVFPLREGKGNGHAVALAREGKPNGGGGGDAADAAAAGNGKGAGVKMVRPYGARGMLSAVIFSVLVQMSAFICDCAAWLWWRHVLMAK